MPTPPRPSPGQRPISFAHATPPAPGSGFGISPTTVVILLVFVAVAVAQVILNLGRFRFSTPRMIGILVVFPIFVAGVLGLVAWFVSGRRDRFFNATVGAVLLFITATRLLIMSGLVTWGTQAPAPWPTAASSGPTGSTSPAPGSSAGRAPTAPPTPPTGGPAPSTAVPSTRVPAAAASPPPPAPKPTVDTAPLLNPFFAELDTESKALATDAQAAYTAATKPGRTPVELDAQITSFKALEARSDALAKRLQRIVTDGIEALKPLDMLGTDAHRAVQARDDTFGSFDRITACQAIMMFARSAADLFTDIKPVRAKVHVNKDGSITSTDPKLDLKLFPNRSNADTWRERGPEALKALRGEK